MQKFKFYLVQKNSEDRLKRVQPHIFRGVLMDILSRVDSKFIEELHLPNQIRPYAISIKRNESSIQFELVILKEELSKAILDFLLSTSDFKLNFNDIEHILLKIDFENIKMDSLIKNTKKVSKFNIRFLTPTYFNIIERGFDLRFPEPTFLFANIAHIWNEFAPIGCKIDSSEFYDWISKNVFVSSYDLITRPFNIGKKAPVVGCVGWANYIIKNQEEGYSSWLDILLRFAEYSNVGGNRTAACGVIKYEPLEILAT